MAQIVWGAAAAHTGGMLRTVGDGEDGARAQRVYDAWGQLRTSLDEARPDVIVMISNDHFMTFAPSLVPTFAIGTGTRFATWGEGGAPKGEHRGISGLGEEVHRALLQAGFDMARARDAGLDHSFGCPLQFLRPQGDLPVLPLFVNCIVEPLPTFARCIELGHALGAALRAQNAAPRVALVGTGGISHWLGVARSGEINEAFDRKFLDLFVDGKIEHIASWDSSSVLVQAGNGVSEIRNWLIAAAAIRGTPRYLAYEPVAAWKTGIGIVEIRPA